jgi:hypothetical protein
MILAKVSHPQGSRVLVLQPGKEQSRCLALINAQGHHIAIGSGVVEYVQREGYSEQFGARPMQGAAYAGSAVRRQLRKAQEWGPAGLRRGSGGAPKGKRRQAYRTKNSIN